VGYEDRRNAEYENRSFDEFLASVIREELADGNLDRLLAAHKRAQAALKRKSTFKNKPQPDAAGPDKGNLTADGLPKHLDAEGKPVDAKGNPIKGKPVKSDVVVTPTVHVKAELIPRDMKVVPPEVVNAIRSASPQLANRMQNHPVDAVFLLTLFMALMSLLQTAMQAYALIHPSAPTPPSPVVIQMFNQMQNVLYPPPGLPAPHG
jgi:hypothetical protein